MYTHGYTNPKEIIFDFAKIFCTLNSVTTDDYANNWKLVYPNIFAKGGPLDGFKYPDFWNYRNGITGSEFQAKVPRIAYDSGASSGTTRTLIMTIDGHIYKVDATEVTDTNAPTPTTEVNVSISGSSMAVGTIDFDYDANDNVTTCTIELTDVDELATAVTDAYRNIEISFEGADKVFYDSTLAHEIPKMTIALGNVDTAEPKIIFATPAEVMESFKSYFNKPNDEFGYGTPQCALYEDLVKLPRIVLKCMGKQDKIWRKKVLLDLTSKTSADLDANNHLVVNIPNGKLLASDGTIRIMIEGKKYSLYRVEDPADVKVIEFHAETKEEGGELKSIITLPASCVGGRILIDYEEDISAGNTFHPYYLQLERPIYVKYDDDDDANDHHNYFYLTWREGASYNEHAHDDMTIRADDVTNVWSEISTYHEGDMVAYEEGSTQNIRYFRAKKDIYPPDAEYDKYPTAAYAAGKDSGTEREIIVTFAGKLWNTANTQITQALATTPPPLYETNTALPMALEIVTDGITSAMAVDSDNTGTIYDSTFDVTQLHIALTDFDDGDQDVGVVRGIKVAYPSDANQAYYGATGKDKKVPEFYVEISSDGTTLTVKDKSGEDYVTPNDNDARVFSEPVVGSRASEYWEEFVPYNTEPAWLNYRQVQETKWSWYKCNATTLGYVQEWLPIEYWMNIDGHSCVAVIMGDPGMSSTDYISSPAYFGQLEQIEGALETDDKGNFAGFSGSDQNPQTRNSLADTEGGIPKLKTFGDYTATGITDVMMVSSKSGRPFQGHKLGLFGMYEFKEQTFNGLSSHTNKYSVTDIVVADVHENERGILKNCLGVPKLGKEHGAELIANRYLAGKEETYIFLHINPLYSPFNTSNDVLIGLAIRTDN